MVSLVVVEEEREQTRILLQTLEQASYKGRQKWSKLTQKKKVAYLDTLLAQAIPCAVYVVTFYNTRYHLSGQ